MSFLKTSKTKRYENLTDEQKEAEGLLMDKARAGQTPYSGDFNISSDFLNMFKDLYSGPGYGQTDFLKKVMDTGMPVDRTELFQKQREIAGTAADKAKARVLSDAAKAGARYSTPAAAAATQAASEVRAKSEANILQQIAQAEEMAKQRQMAGAQLLQQFQLAQEQGLLNASRIDEAAKQWEKGMDYEEFKRMHPDVYKLLLSIWGRNVDFTMEHKPTAFGNLLQTAAVAAQFFGGGGGGAPQYDTQMTSGGGGVPMTGNSSGFGLGLSDSSVFGG